MSQRSPARTPEPVLEVRAVGSDAGDRDDEDAAREVSVVRSPDLAPAVVCRGAAAGHEGVGTVSGSLAVAADDSGCGRDLRRLVEYGLRPRPAAAEETGATEVGRVEASGDRRERLGEESQIHHGGAGPRHAGHRVGGQGPGPGGPERLLFPAETGGCEDQGRGHRQGGRGHRGGHDASAPGPPGVRPGCSMQRGR